MCRACSMNCGVEEYIWSFSWKARMRLCARTAAHKTEVPTVLLSLSPQSTESTSLWTQTLPSKSFLTCSKSTYHSTLQILATDGVIKLLNILQLKKEFKRFFSKILWDSASKCHRQTYLTHTSNIMQHEDLLPSNYSTNNARCQATVF